MKLTYVVGNVTVEFETDTVRDGFAQLATFQEVFGETLCGKCGSENVKFIVRENEGNEYYELRCADCHARLAFGAHKKGGGLFPRRKDSDGNWLPDNGWTKWNAKTKAVE